MKSKHFLRGGRDMVEDEPATIAWFAVRMGPTTFGIFNAFPDDAGREAHLPGKVALALMEKAPDLLMAKPAIEKLDVIAAKTPEHSVNKSRIEPQPRRRRALVPIQLRSAFLLGSCCSSEVHCQGVWCELYAGDSCAEICDLPRVKDETVALCLDALFLLGVNQ